MPDTQPSLALHRPTLGQEELDAVAQVLSSGHLVQGPRVAAFERLLCEYLGVDHAIACSSGTAALHLSYAALEVAPGDDVIVPAFGYPATANAVELLGGRAIPADIDPERMALSVKSVARVATERTVGVVPVHPFGIPAPMAELEALAEERGWWVCEDAACAMGTALDGRWARGEHLICLSFHPRKTLTTGEGGAVVTRDARLAERLRILRNHGVATDFASRGWSRFTHAGFNYRLTDIAAAIGEVQMSRLDAIIDERRRVVALYRDRLDTAADWRVPAGFDLPELSMQSFVVEYIGDRDRDRILRDLAEGGVQATIAGYCLFEQPYWTERYALDPTHYPVSARMGQRGVTLPVVADMNAHDVDRVVTALEDCAGGS